MSTTVTETIQEAGDPGDNDLDFSLLGDFVEEVPEDDDDWNDMSLLDLNDKDDDDQYIQQRENLELTKDAGRRQVEEQTAKIRKKEEESVKKREVDKEKRMRYSPPGLKIFQDETLRFFKRRNLNLEKDFDYKQRPYFRRVCGFSDEHIDEMFNIPWKFILHLSPGIDSPMIQDSVDFVKVCDFLFFSHVSTQNLDTAEMTKKALFCMLRGPYEFREWKLSLTHILPALLNLGLQENSVLTNDIWNNQVMSYRLGKLKKKFDKDDFLPQFFKNRFNYPKRQGDYHVDPSSDTDHEEYNIKLSYLDSDSADENDNPRKTPEDYKWKKSKKDITVRVIQMICDIITTFPQYCEVVPSKDPDWTQALATFYILSTVASDWHIIVDHKIKRYISEAFRVILDHFPKEVWKSGQLNEDGNKDFLDSVCCDITEALSAVCHYEGAENIFTWDRRDVHAQFKMKEHHHNLVRRVWLLPMTHRGRIIRKMLAYHYLHYFVTKSEGADTFIIPFADVADLWTFMNKHQSVLKGFESDFYSMYNLIRLMDVIVGNEPDMDFHIKVYDQFVEPIEKYLKEIMVRTQKEGEKGDAAKLNSFIKAVTGRWTLFHNIWKRGKQKELNKYELKKKEIEAKKNADIENADIA